MLSTNLSSSATILAEDSKGGDFCVFIASVAFKGIVVAVLAKLFARRPGGRAHRGDVAEVEVVAALYYQAPLGRASLSLLWLPLTIGNNPVMSP